VLEGRSHTATFYLGQTVSGCLGPPFGNRKDNVTDKLLGLILREVEIVHDDRTRKPSSASCEGSLGKRDLQTSFRRGKRPAVPCSESLFGSLKDRHWNTQHFCVPDIYETDSRWFALR
jgi:hypothetical protein